MGAPAAATPVVAKDRIDYQFISDLEGGAVLKGYVPAAGVSNSGVTIATGFDLGARNEHDLKALGLSATLVAKLKPYLGKKKTDAKTFLAANPLSITKAEAQTIDKAVKKKQVDQLKTKYLGSPHNTAKKQFFALPAEAQTVIASVAFQYGTNLSAAAPKFWKAASSQDWKETVKILKAFGDAYPTRRGKEAKRLEKIAK